MTKEQIRNLDVRIRNNMLVNHQLDHKEVEEALTEREDLPDLTDKLVLCQTLLGEEAQDESEEEDDAEEEK